MKGSVYIYDRNITRFPGRFDAEFLLPEFCAAAFDAEHHSKMRSLQNRRVIATQTGTSYMRQDFDIGSNRSVLAMTVARQNYVKLRVTWLAEPVFNDIGNEFIDAVVDLASRHSSVH
jgi:hypothetical protein